MVDVGEYYCHAENAFGSMTQPVSVRIRNVATSNNVTQCCMEQNVTSACMDACTFHVDIDAVKDKPECIQVCKCTVVAIFQNVMWNFSRTLINWWNAPLMDQTIVIVAHTLMFLEDVWIGVGENRFLTIKFAFCLILYISWNASNN